MATYSRYLDIAAKIRSRIEAGEWKVSERLPRLDDFGAEYGANRDTIARAIKVLEAEGYVLAVQGRGITRAHRTSPRADDGLPRHSVSVAAAIVRDDGRVLAIQRRDDDTWEPPGGVLELEESITAGLRREVREETGLDVAPDCLTGVYKNMELGVVSLVFRCRQIGGTPRQTDEAAEVAWLTEEDVRQLMAEAFAVRILDALAGQWPRVRSHDGVRLI